MITEAQHEILRDLGRKISIAESVVRENNARRFEYWWAVGKELEKPEYHTGRQRGHISIADMHGICEDLGLSTTRRKGGKKGAPGITGAKTVYHARRLAREYPDGAGPAVLAYKAWGYYCASADNTTSSKAATSNVINKGAGAGARGVSKGIPTPHNVRAQVYIPALEEFMASTGEDWAVAKMCLFGALREMGVDELVRLMRQYYDNHPLVQSAVA